MTATPSPATVSDARAAGARSGTSLGRRVGSIILLQFANPMTLLGWPLIILAVIFLGNLAVVVAVTQGSGGRAEFTVNGGVGFLWVYTLVMVVLSVNQSFPLALGYGATRRDYLLGAAATYGALSVVYALLLATLAEIERANNGWGVGLGFFAALPEWPWHQVFLAHLLILVLFASIGAATAAIYVRWKAAGMYVFWLGLVILLVVAVFLLSTFDGWFAVRDFFQTAGVMGSLLWSLVITTFSSIAAYVILRRATPTNT